MRAILVSLLLLCSIGGNAANVLTINVDQASRQFDVTLPSNPTTGYQWTATTYDKNILKLTNSYFVAPQTKLIGAGGQMIFTFALLKGKAYPKNTPLTFTYARAWEPMDGTLKKVMVNFVKK